MTHGGGSDHQAAVGHGIGHGIELFGAGQDVRGAHGGTSTLKRYVVWIYYPQVVKSKIAHRPGCGANIERIACVHQDDAQVIEFDRKGQAILFYGTAR